MNKKLKNNASGFTPKVAVVGLSATLIVSMLLYFVINSIYHPSISDKINPISNLTPTQTEVPIDPLLPTSVGKKISGTKSSTLSWEGDHSVFYEFGTLPTGFSIVHYPKNNKYDGWETVALENSKAKTIMLFSTPYEMYPQDTNHTTESLVTDNFGVITVVYAKKSLIDMVTYGFTVAYVSNSNISTIDNVQNYTAALKIPKSYVYFKALCVDAEESNLSICDSVIKKLKVTTNAK